MTKISFILIGLFLVDSSLEAKTTEPPTPKIVITMTQKNIAAIDPEKSISREKFEHGTGGLFKVRIPKALFPIPAPKLS